jgi:hypothetical protein
MLIPSQFASTVDRGYENFAGAITEPALPCLPRRNWKYGPRNKKARSSRASIDT